MVRRNLMIAALDKQRRLLEQLAEELTQRLDRKQRLFMADCLFCCDRTAEAADNLDAWLDLQKGSKDHQTSGSLESQF